MESDAIKIEAAAMSAVSSASCWFNQEMEPRTLSWAVGHRQVMELPAVIKVFTGLPSSLNLTLLFSFGPPLTVSFQFHPFTFFVSFFFHLALGG